MKNDMTDYQLENLILHYVTEEDLKEVARTWPADHHPLSDTEARETITRMSGNYGRNSKGCMRLQFMKAGTSDSQTVRHSIQDQPSA